LQTEPERNAGLSRRPLQEQKRPAEAGLASRVERQSVEGFTAVPGAADEGIGLYAGRREALLEIETPQHLGDIGAENDAGADAREARRLLIHRDGKARALQQSRGRQAGQSGAQNCNPCSAIHPLTPHRPRSMPRWAHRSLSNECA